MKKILVTILALVYLASSSGTSIYTHYCMGKFAGWGITDQSEKKCGKCGMVNSGDNDNGCCQDKHQFFKTSHDQQFNGNAFQSLLIESVALPVSFFQIPAARLVTLTAEKPSCHAPPRGGGTAIYILNRIFLI